jgi:3-oxoadipate CoA-transferase beta subunit
LIGCGFAEEPLLASGWTPDEMAALVAADLPARSVVNLGIGLPTLVASHVPSGSGILLHSENGIIGLGPPPAPGTEDEDLIDAGKAPASLVTGAAIVDQATSFAVIRGGRLDVAVLGAFQVAENGDLANWRVRGTELGSVGGAMDIAIGAQRLFVLMRHVDRNGRPKLLRACAYPLTAQRCVRRVYTDLAIIDVHDHGFVVRRSAPGVEQDALRRQTDAPLRFEETESSTSTA